MKTNFFCFGILVALASGCSHRPSLQITTAPDIGNPTFELNMSRISGMLDLTIWQISDQKILWDVNLNYFAGSRLIYGKVPVGFASFNGQQRDAVQRFPLSGIAPAPLPPDANLQIQVTVQYDTFSTAAATDFFFDARTDGKGCITSLEPTRDLASLRIPRRPQENEN